MIDVIAVDVLLVCMASWYENASWIAGPFRGESIDRSMDSPHNAPEMQSFDFSFVISLDKLLNE